MSATITSRNGRFYCSYNTPDGDIFSLALWINEAVDLFNLVCLFRLTRSLIPRAVYFDVEGGKLAPSAPSPFLVTETIRSSLRN